MLKYKIPQIVTLTHEILFKEYPDIKKGYYLSMRLGLIYHQRNHQFSNDCNYILYSKRPPPPGQGILPVYRFHHSSILDERERKTRLELATLTLARLCSSAFCLRVQR